MRTLSHGSAGLKVEVWTLEIQNAEQEYNRSTTTFDNKKRV